MRADDPAVIAGTRAVLVRTGAALPASAPAATERGVRADPAGAHVVGRQATAAVRLPWLRRKGARGREARRAPSIGAMWGRAEPMPPQTVECFYSLSSPWMYLAGPRLRAMLDRHGARLVLRPYDFQQVVPRTGGVPLRTRPRPRQDYHAQELDRWRRHLGMELALAPRHYPPADQRPAGRMVMAAQARGLDALRLSHAILAALWAEERDIAVPAVRVAIAEEQGLPGAELLGAEEDPAIRAEWDRNNAEAEARGVFGSPTFFAAFPWGELWLWGQDRLFFLDQALGGAAVQTP